MTEQIWDKTIWGRDLASFWLQAGFVEGIITDSKSFRSLENAYYHIFRRNKEFAIFLWNGIPVRIHYQEDLPLMIRPLIEMLYHVQKEKKSRLIKFVTPNIKTNWLVKVEGEFLHIDSHWEQLGGGYQEALNLLAILRMPLDSFLFEWKLLLAQCIQAIYDANVQLSSQSARTLFDRLIEIERNIPKRGRFYRYEDRN